MHNLPNLQLGYPGVSSLLSEHLLPIELVFQDFAHVHLASVEAGIADRFSALRKKEGARSPTISLDIGASMLSPGPIQKAQIKSIFLKFDYVFFNQLALKSFFDIDIDKSHPDWWVAELQSFIASDKSSSVSFLVTQGDKGSCFITKSVWQHHPAFTTIPLDTTGAGDTFAAFFLFYHLLKKDPHALGKANLAAAYKIRKSFGGCSGAPSIDLLERLWQEPGLLQQENSKL